MMIGQLEQKVRVAVVGLGFGRHFAPIYQAHRNSVLEAICCLNETQVREVGDKYKVKKLYTDYQEVLDDKDIDAIHIVTPCQDHAWMSIAAMKAGKHTACTVPVGMSLNEIREVVKTQKETGMTYMMMETAIFTREYLYIQNLRDNGKIGKIQFVRGSHLQDMSIEGWSEFWNGLPPMWYSTHCVGPCLEIVNAGGLAHSVSCRGSGTIREDYIPLYNSPFSFETAHLKVRNSDVICEVSRFVHGVTRQYCETLDVYGSKTSVEWRRKSDDGLLLFNGGENVEIIDPPDATENLPEEIMAFTLGETVSHKEHASFIQGRGHGGSYPHLVNEFVGAIIEGRKPLIDIVKAANWSAVGFCAHQSALEGGESIDIPDYSKI